MMPLRHVALLRFVYAFSLLFFIFMLPLMRAYAIFAADAMLLDAMPR